VIVFILKYFKVKDYKKFFPGIVYLKSLLKKCLFNVYLSISLKMNIKIILRNWRLNVKGF